MLRATATARLRAAARRLAARARADTSGIAAVEFALILPLMITLYLGCVELTQGVMASRKTAILGRTLSDLVAQQLAGSSMNSTTMASIFSASASVMAPFPTTSVQMTVSAVQFVPNATSPAPATVANGYEAKVRWSATSGTGATARNCIKMTPVTDSSVKPTMTTLPAGLYASGSLVIADVSYQYTPNFGGSVLAWSTTSSSIAMSNTSYMKPRNSTASCNSNNDSWICYPTQQTGTCATY